jgi:hypothetical protein
MQRLLILAFMLTVSMQPAGAQQITDAQREACMGDYQQFCSGVIPGGGRIIACLRKNQDRISSQCRAVLPPVQPTR